MAFYKYLLTIYGNLLTVIRVGEGKMRAAEGALGADKYFQYCLIIQMILKYKIIIKINLMVFINLPKIKDEAYVINLDEYRLIVNHWIALCVKSESYDATYFDSFWAEHIPKEI